MTMCCREPVEEGYEIVFRKWRTDPRTGKILYASNFGLKAWPIKVKISPKAR